MIILPRRTAWRYSEQAPEFFNGECFCCATPPPPTSAAYYYYNQTPPSQSCTYCPATGNQLATRWLLEVAGIADKAANPAPCAHRPIVAGCENNNGTFILSPAAFGSCCARVSPTFSASTLLQAGACGICATETVGYYRLSICSTGNVVVSLVSPTYAEIPVQWFIDRTLFNCMGTNTLALQTSFFSTGSGGLNMCCEGSPATVTISPIT